MALVFRSPTAPEARDARRRHGPAPGLAGILAVLVLTDVLASLLGLHLGVWLHDLLVHGSLAGRGPDPRLALAALALPAGYCLLDLYRPHGQAPVERFPLRIKATGGLLVLLALGQHAAGLALWPKGAVLPVLLLTVLLTLGGEGAARAVLIRLGLWSLPVVVIGAGPTGRRVVRLLLRRPELGLHPVGFFDGGHTGPRPDPPGAPDVPVLGSVADSAAWGQRVKTAIVTTPAEAHPGLDTVAMQLGFRSIIVVPELDRMQTLGVRARDLEGLLGLQMRRNLLLARNRLLKKAADHLVALPLLALCVPLMAVLALWIMAVSPGCPFYGQMRVGRNGRPFRMWKLRTMYPDAEHRLERHLAADPRARREWERCFKLSADPRILPGVGHVLRRTSLDELPQICNVLRGEMSLVGPRPFPQYHLDRFDGRFRSLRASVTPGITGLWQVSARSDGDLAVQQELDSYYIRNWSVWLDLYILARTLGAVLACRGAR